MKKLICLFISLSITIGIICSFSISSYAASPIENIYINGQPIDFSEAERPYIQNDRTMIPLRAIAEALGATVYWFNTDKKIQIVRYDTTLRLVIGLPRLDIYKIDGEEQALKETVELDAPAFQGDITRDFRTFVPARAISETFGADVNAKFVNEDEGKTDRAMNVYILDDYDETKENVVSIADLYDKKDVQDKTLISTVGIISKLDSKYYLQDENEPYKMIPITDIPEVENFWTEQLGVENNNPIGTKVKITTMVSLNDESGYSIPIKRAITGIRTIEKSNSSSPVVSNEDKTTATPKPSYENLFAD